MFITHFAYNLKMSFAKLGVLGLLVVIGIVGTLYLTSSNQINPTTASPTPSASHSTSTNNSSVVISKGDQPKTDFQLADGFRARVFAQGLGLARDLQFSPGGTLLVSDPAGGRVYALPDKNNDGVADEKMTVISGLNRGHGLAFYNNQLFVAEVDQVARYNWDEQNLTAKLDKVLFDLPKNSNHNNRTLLFDQSGNLYISVGSTCNVCNEADPRSATVMISNANGDNPRTFAKGLRNAPFMAINPTSDEIWSTEMGRDNLGDNIPPDEIDIIKQGQDYGWPRCYGARIHDTNFDKSSTDPCGNTTLPIFEVPAHSAPLGLTFINSRQFPADWQGDLLVAYHGSWNRSVPDGYKVVRLNVEGNKITGAQDFMTGFINGRIVSARPVDVTFDKSGNLYLSDDRASSVYIIQHP